ncbi:cation:proton antiporter [Actinomadura roseirufa]|uniref:cation:proton antiporter n=1 Tax=Actinomadura roseirufa TaxID=2094049 RepID=UPI001F5ECCF1|nr:cation:proton antiporter [Actinomadura roseirufa]
MGLAAAPVAPLSSHQLLVFLLQVAVLLILALAMGRLGMRLGMPAVVGELCAGVVLGPSLLDHLAPDLTGWLLPKQPVQYHLMDAFGQIGVLLLVGLTGIQLDLTLVRRRGLAAAKISLFGLLVPLVLGVACGLTLPGSLFAAGAERGVCVSFLAVAMCVSAIPVIAKTLMDMNLLHRNIGQLTLTAGMIDDAVGWLMLSIVSAMATVGVSTGKVATSIGYLLLVLVAAVLLRAPIGALLRRVVARGEPALTIGVMIAMMLLAAAASHRLGLESIFGGFVCGIVIGSTGAVEASHLAPLRTIVLGFMAPVFFATAGLRMDLTALGRPSVLLAAVVVLVVAIAGKFTGAFAGARLSRLDRWEALALGAGMNARGVVEVVVAMAGLRLGVLSTETYTIIVLVAIVTSLMAPPILRLAMRRVELTAEEDLRERAFTWHEPVRPESPDGVA